MAAVRSGARSPGRDVAKGRQESSSCDVPAGRRPRPRPFAACGGGAEDSQEAPILAIGSPVGREPSPRKSYPAVLESLLEKALAGIDVAVAQPPGFGRDRRRPPPSASVPRSRWRGRTC